MDEVELQDLELQWLDNGSWYTNLVGSLESYLRLEGKLSKEAELQMLENLIETQDNVMKLNRYSNSYTDEQIANMRKCLTLLLKCAKIPSRLQGVLEKTAKRLMNYLGKIKGYRDEYSQYPYYYEEKSNQEKLYEEKVKRLEGIIRDVSSELSTKAKEELSKRKEVRPKTEKSILELSLEKEQRLQDKIAEVSNMMILEHFKRKYR